MQARRAGAAAATALLALRAFILPTESIKPMHWRPIMIRALGSLALLLGMALVVAADDQGTTVTLGGLSSQTPAEWKARPPATPTQVKVFTLPKAEGDAADATLTIFFFGQGQGGDAKANIARWKGMFKAPAGKNIDDVAKEDTFSAGGAPPGGAKVTRIDLAGTYLHKARPIDPTAEERPNHRLIGVVFETKDGTYYMRLVGPEKTVARHAKGFEEWLKNFK
jgi:hypothetical protein